MKSICVLVTSAGVESAVNIIKSLRLQSELVVEIIAFDVDRFASGLYLADHHYVSPPISDKERYWKFICEICQRHKIRALYPCYSKEIAFIAGKKEILKEMGIATLLPSCDVIALCDDKHASIELAEKIGIPIPKVINNPRKEDIPVFSKPLKSSSSRGAALIEDEHMLRYYLASGEERLYQEFIDGQEYTVDVLCDENAKAVFCGPRKRISVKAGQTVKGVTVNNSIINDYVKRLCEKIGFIGVCNIQFMERDGRYYFIEINPRYAAGGLMVTVHAGANLPLLALKLMMGIPVLPVETQHKANIVMTRYWKEIIIDSSPDSE